MHIKLNIFHVLSRKAVCIIFIMLISVNFALGGALAKSCKGGPDCANCVALAHTHVPGAEAGMGNFGCRPGDKNDTCGFEAGRIPNEFYGITSAFRSDNHEFSGIFTAVSDGYGPSYLSREFISLFLSPDSGRITPIYLINQSLLC